MLCQKRVGEKKNTHGEAGQPLSKRLFAFHKVFISKLTLDTHFSYRSTNQRAWEGQHLASGLDITTNHPWLTIVMAR